MNPDQIKSVAARLLTAVSAIAVAVGVLDQATATQVLSEASVVLNSGIAIAGAVGTIWSILDALWKHTHENQIKAAANSIAATGDVKTLAPVMAALKDAGATVVPGPLMPLKPAGT